MAVGASFADLAVILVDAKQGVLVQTRRHARICALMGIRYFVFAVNKMDLVDYSEERFKEIVDQIQELSKELHLASVKIIPVSATEGDNVTTHSDNMPWYAGATACLLREYRCERKEAGRRLLYAGTACLPSGSHVPWFPGTDREWRCIGR